MKRSKKLENGALTINLPEVENVLNSKAMDAVDDVH